MALENCQFYSVILISLLGNKKIRENEYLVDGLCVGLGAGLVTLLRAIFSLRMWRSVGNWLIGTDKVGKQV